MTDAYFDLPPGPDLAKRNRRIIAERLHWPTDAAKDCERVEAAAPDWWTTWSHGGGLTWTKPGYYAHRRQWHIHDGLPRWVYGATPEELKTAISNIEIPDRRTARGWPTW